MQNFLKGTFKEETKKKEYPAFQGYSKCPQEMLDQLANLANLLEEQSKSPDSKAITKIKNVEDAFWGGIYSPFKKEFYKYCEEKKLSLKMSDFNNINLLEELLDIWKNRKELTLHHLQAVNCILTQTVQKLKDNQNLDEERLEKLNFICATKNVIEKLLLKRIYNRVESSLCNFYTETSYSLNMMGAWKNRELGYILQFDKHYKNQEEAVQNLIKKDKKAELYGKQRDLINSFHNQIADRIKKDKRSFKHLKELGKEIEENESLIHTKGSQSSFIVFFSDLMKAIFTTESVPEEKGLRENHQIKPKGKVRTKKRWKFQELFGKIHWQFWQPLGKTLVTDEFKDINEYQPLEEEISENLRDIIERNNKLLEQKRKQELDNKLEIKDTSQKAKEKEDVIKRGNSEKNTTSVKNIYKHAVPNDTTPHGNNPNSVFYNRSPPTILPENQLTEQPQFSNKKH